MRRRRLMLAPVLLVGALAVAPPVGAAGPIISGPEHEEGVAPIGDCGSFQIVDHYSVDVTFRLFLDADGNPDRAVETVSGVDRLTNSVTGKQVIGRFANSVLIDFTTGLGASSGIVFRVTVPGAGAIFLDVGRFVSNRDGSIVTFRAGPHQFADGDFGALCAALA